jgi:hypothetical protein
MEVHVKTGRNQSGKEDDRFGRGWSSVKII